MRTSETHRAIDAVWRIESARFIAGLARLVRDVGVAEELAQDALVAALEQWPVAGIPDNPGAWLMATAKHRAIDSLRRKTMAEQKHEQLGYETDTLKPPADSDFDDELDDDIGDDLLRLIGGLTTDEIAKAFLVPEPTMAQRIVRAKRALTEAKVPFEIPRSSELAARLASVLQVIYLIFNEGYSATAGDDWVRPALCEDALRLGRILADLTPEDREVCGLVALMEIQASRLRARVDAAGEPVLLLDQDRSRWDQLLIHRGLAALEKAEKLGGAPGPYFLQAAIAACHARALTAADTEWVRIAALYAALVQIAPSPVIELNRAVALSMAFGPEAGLELVDTLTSEPSLKTYHLLYTVRGDLLEKLGRRKEARLEFEQAASLAQNVRERKFLLERADKL